MGDGGESEGGCRGSSSRCVIDQRYSTLYVQDLDPQTRPSISSDNCRIFLSQLIRTP